MRRTLLAGLCLFFATGSGVLFAQNKTLGVGVAAPNPNAALHIESPTANQGFIMPRLTTVQRTGMSALLSDTDRGLMLFDTDLNTVFIWNGLSWQTTAEVAGGMKLSYPYKDSVALPTGTNDLFALKYNNDEPKRIFRLENHGVNNGSSTLSVFNAGTGPGGYFQTSNSTTTSSTLMATTNSDAGGELAPVAVYGESTGAGSLAASFRINNASNTYPALFAETNGVGRVATFNKIGTEGGQPAVFINSQGGHGIWADHNGANGYAAIIQNINASNPTPAMFVEAVGSGQSIWAQKSLPESTGNAIFGEHLGGSGNAGYFLIDNASNSSAAVSARTNGTGAAVHAENTGVADGFAGSFHNTDAANTYPAIQASTEGNGSGVRVIQTTGTGPGMDVMIQNTASTAPGFMADHAGLGNAGFFIINNVTSSSPSVSAVTNGTGSALEAVTSSGYTALHARQEGSADGNAAIVEITGSTNAFPALQANTAGTGYAINAQHTGSTGDAIYGERAGSGSGSAGNFRISNPLNLASSLHASTTAADGTAIGANNEANGIAFAVWGGGVQITTQEVTTASIGTRASAYRITAGGTLFTLDFGPKDGEVFMIFNETGGIIEVAGVTLPDGEGKTFIVFPGSVIRGL